MSPFFLCLMNSTLSLKQWKLSESLRIKVLRISNVRFQRWALKGAFSQVNPISQDCSIRPISLDAVSFAQTVTYHILCWRGHRLSLNTVTRSAEIPRRRCSEPPVCQLWAAAPQGVPSFIAFSSPCTRFEGVGSGHFIKLVSTHCMIASPFLKMEMFWSLQ